MRALTYIGTVVRRRLGRTTEPRMVTWILTFACNARCIMCDSWRKPQGGELDRAEALAVIDRLPRLDAVRLTGGEPLLRADLAELVEALRRRCRPLLLHLTTNGFLTSRIVAFCEERNRTLPLHLLISMDGVGEVHNRIRGRGDAWKRSLATLEALAPRVKELNLRLAVNQTVVDREGLDEYGRLREFLRPYGVRNQLVVAYEGSATYSVKEKDFRPTVNGRFPAFCDLPGEAVDRRLGEALADLDDYPFTVGAAKRYYLRGLRNRLLEGRAAPNPPCAALHSHLRILPDGTVPVCQFNPTLVGNLAEESLAEIWHGDRIVPHRRWVQQCPGCWAECEIAPSAIYSGDLLINRG